MSLLDYLDNYINDFFSKNKIWPSIIECSSKTKDKIMALYKQDLKFFYKQDKTFDIGDLYRGIPFKIKDQEKIEVK